MELETQQIEDGPSVLSIISSGSVSFGHLRWNILIREATVRICYLAYDKATAP